MQTTDGEYNRLLVRVASLERQGRFWKIAVLLMILVTWFSFTANVGAQTDPGVREKNTTVVLGRSYSGLGGEHEGKDDGGW
jgi:hypothetical protein